jgi:hypothetical protein
MQEGKDEYMAERERVPVYRAGAMVAMNWRFGMSVDIVFDRSYFKTDDMGRRVTQT